MKTEKMSKKTFWIRFATYVIFGGVIPFAFLTWRFQLFSKVSKLSIGGWGIVAIIFVALFFIKLIKAVREGLPFSLGSQILEGVCKVLIPILAAVLIVHCGKDVMNQIYQFLWILFFSEMIAIVANPLPQWAHENKINESNKKMNLLLNTLGIINDNKEVKK